MEAITLAIEGYNAEKLKIQEFLATRSNGDATATTRLREIDAAIVALMTMKEAA